MANDVLDVLTGFAKESRIDIFEAFKTSGQNPSSLYLDWLHWPQSGHFLVAAIFKALYPALLADMKK